MVAFIITAVFMTLLVAAAFAGSTGIGAADRRNANWSLFPLGTSEDNASRTGRAV